MRTGWLSLALALTTSLADAQDIQGFWRATLQQLAADPETPDFAFLFIQALQAIVSGSRDKTTKISSVETLSLLRSVDQSSDIINAVAALDTTLAPIDLLDEKPLLAARFNEDLPDSVPRGQRITGMVASQARLAVQPSKFAFQPGGKCGTRLSDLLPHTRDIADEIWGGIAGPAAGHAAGSGRCGGTRCGAARGDDGTARRRHRPRQHSLQHALHRGRPGRPAVDRRGDGPLRRAGAWLDACGLLCGGGTGGLAGHAPFRLISLPAEEARE